jgi:hypothetical protein
VPPTDIELDPGQQAVVDHEGGPLLVDGGFGTGKSVALRARAERLRAEGRRPLLVHHRDLVDLAVAILRRHGRTVELVHPSGLRHLVGTVVDTAGVDVDEAVAAIVGFQASFLGDEELRVHADAAGCLDVAEELISATARHRAVMAERGLVDAGGALVEASLLLRDLDVLAAERGRFDELLIDDFQLASFATNRLVSQLAGAGGDVVVAGHADAAVSTMPLASATHLERFPRRFGAAPGTLTTRHRSPTVAPELRLLDERASSADAAWAVRGGVRRADVLVVGRDDVEGAVGAEAGVAIVHGATDGAWPAPPPAFRWFDPELFHGPDVPEEVERARRWRERERRRFLVATSRATERTIVLAHVPVTPFVSDLLG